MTLALLKGFEASVQQSKGSEVTSRGREASPEIPCRSNGGDGRSGQEKVKVFGVFMAFEWVLRIYEPVDLKRNERWTVCWLFRSVTVPKCCVGSSNFSFSAMPCLGSPSDLLMV